MTSLELNDKRKLKSSLEILAGGCQSVSAHPQIFFIRGKCKILPSCNGYLPNWPFLSYFVSFLFRQTDIAMYRAAFSVKKLVKNVANGTDQLQLVQAV